MLFPYYGALSVTSLLIVYSKSRYRSDAAWDLKSSVSDSHKGSCRLENRQSILKRVHSEARRRQSLKSR
jgi:hypothetical protein